MKLTREVKRYDLGIAKSPLTGQDIMNHLEYADGTWVKYVDIADLLQSPVNLAKPLAESAVAPGECGSVPDGWKLVPIVLDPDMRAVLTDVLYRHKEGQVQFWANIWDRLLVAAPSGISSPTYRPNEKNVIGEGK